MQRKISNIKYKLHSIPMLSSSLSSQDDNNLMKNKVKSNVLYSIPCVKACAYFCRKVLSNKVCSFFNTLCAGGAELTSEHAVRETRDDGLERHVPSKVVLRNGFMIISCFLFVGFLNCIFWGSNCMAIDVSGTNTNTSGDNDSVEDNIAPYGIGATTKPDPDGTTSTTSPTLSLSLSNPNMTSSAITPGNTTTVSTNVSVKVDNAESYSLILKVDSTTLKNGNTTITAGNVVNNNTWGYKWDTETSYTAPSTSGKNLTVPALTNNSVDFTKTLTFGAKFSTSAEAGHYRGSGTLSLVAEPRVIATAKWSNGADSGIVYMQEMTSSVCNQVSSPAVGASTAPTLKLIDSRDNKEYNMVKLQDNRCWMQNDLQIENATLTPSNSNVSMNFILPASSDNISSTNINQLVVSIKEQTGYYNWYTATAGTGKDLNTDGDSASGSICPKGWKLPTRVEYDNLWLVANIEYAETQAMPYNFSLSGYTTGNTTYYKDQMGYYWTSVVQSSSIAYSVLIRPSKWVSGTPGDPDIGSRYLGYAIRCIAAS